MKVTIDTSLCNGYGNCAFSAPDVFDIDLASNLAVLRDDVDLDQADAHALHEAAADCPVQAIRLSS